MENIVIVGGVAAGATAAARARRLSPTARIVLLEAGPDISFANCGLPYAIGGDIKARSSLILQSPESFREQYDVEVHTHTLASRLDRSAQVVHATDTRSGESRSFPYTKLILAQGGRPVMPAWPGIEHEHVFSLWTLEDMDRIIRHLAQKQPKHAVVVGGGFIGLEMVEALVKRGLKVSVIEQAPHVMGLMEPEIAGVVHAELAAHGVELFTRTSVTELTKTEVKLDQGTVLKGDLVLVSVGVRPTLELVKQAGLELGEAGGLLVDESLRTSDPNIFAAGDMIELEHRVSGTKTRIPLAGPANRQGRLAAENALGGTRTYPGALGTSVVRVFDAVVGMTGLSLKQARGLGIPADAVVVHKEHHTAYYPNAVTVSVLVVYDRETGRILGGQVAGEQGADKRLDVLALAAATGITLDQLAEVDFAYSPPIGTANDALNMAAFTAQNRRSGFSPAVTASELDEFVAGKQPVFIDLRDTFAYEKSHVEGALSLPLELLRERLTELPRERLLLVYDETGKKGHRALRTLLGAGFNQVVNLSGGHLSLERHARALGFAQLAVELLPISPKTLHQDTVEASQRVEQPRAVPQNTPLVVDVRTPMEFAAGAFPGALNIPLDELEARLEELGPRTREITVYCASGARSAYAQRMLAGLGFHRVQNGGGLAQMMRRR